MLHNNLKEKVIFELSELENELKNYGLLFKICKERTPDLIEMTALSSVLHSFYNGIENIFLLISKNIDKYVTENFNWHSDLLLKMAEKSDKRNNVISQELLDNLKEYLGFRHFFRHNYKYRLDWMKLESLNNNLEITWNMFKKEINNFISNL